MEGKMQICRKKNLKKQPIINKIRRAKLRIPQSAYVTINQANWLFVGSKQTFCHLPKR